MDDLKSPLGDLGAFKRGTFETASLKNGFRGRGLINN